MPPLTPNCTGRGVDVVLDVLVVVVVVVSCAPTRVAATERPAAKAATPSRLRLIPTSPRVKIRRVRRPWAGSHLLRRPMGARRRGELFRTLPQYTRTTVS